MTDAGGALWLGWRGAQWLAVCSACVTLVALAESFLGHYRSGFALRMQYSPFAAGFALVGACLIAVLMPTVSWVHALLRWAGVASAGLSIIGVGYHWYYGVIEKPGGTKWLLHHLMYHAPLLAPLALGLAGGIAIAAGASLSGRDVVGMVSPSLALSLLTIAGVAGLVLQAGVLHYRGAFNNRAMWLPLIVGSALIGASAVALVWPSRVSRTVHLAMLWTTFIVGFAGWGWHLRGLDRTMGGLYVTAQNLMEGPPPFAPLLFALVAMTGIIGVELL